MKFSLIAVFITIFAASGFLAGCNQNDDDYDYPRRKPHPYGEGGGTHGAHGHDGASSDGGHGGRGGEGGHAW
jgi:hypothetical protein